MLSSNWQVCGGGEDYLHESCAGYAAKDLSLKYSFLFFILGKRYQGFFMCLLGIPFNILVSGCICMYNRALQVSTSFPGLLEIKSVNGGR